MEICVPLAEADEFSGVILERIGGVELPDGWVSVATLEGELSVKELLASGTGAAAGVDAGGTSAGGTTGAVVDEVSSLGTVLREAEDLSDGATATSACGNELETTGV